MAEATRYSVGLDLGTTKIAMAQLQQVGHNAPEIIAFSQQPCRFLKNGLIANLEPLMDAVSHCLSEIRSLSHVPVKSVAVNCTTGNLQSIRRDGWIEFQKPREILQKHILQVHQAARSSDDSDHILIHEIPQHYDVDDLSDIDSPIGMMGEKLGVSVRQIYGQKKDVQNIMHSISKCGLRISHVVAEAFALTESLLTQDDRVFEFWLLDLGGKHTQLAIVAGNMITPLPLIQSGGDIITSDISIALKTPVKEAERIKVKFGCARNDFAQDSVQIEIPGLGGMAPGASVSQQLLTQIVQSRVDEIFEEITKVFHANSARGQYFAGVILTGGASCMAGMREIAEAHFQTRVIPGKLRNIGGLKDIAPCCEAAVCIGLALYALRHPRQPIEITHDSFSIINSVKRCFNWFGGGCEL